MGTLSGIKNHAFQNADEAINYLYDENTKYRTVILYASKSNDKKLKQEIKKVYDEIKRRNAEISDVNQQMLPTSPYYWDDIDGCLAVTCVEISMDTFEKSAGCLFLFTSPRYDCLTKSDERKPLSSKAMTSLAILGSMISKT